MTLLLPKTLPTFAAKFNASILAFSALLTICASAHAAPKGEELLRAMINAEHTISYSATETTTRVGAPVIVTQVQKSGMKRRLEYSAPAIMKGDLLLSDGANLWLYHRAEKSAVKTNSARRDAADGKEMRGRVSVTTSGQSTQAGRKAWLVTASSRDKKRVLSKIWIDRQTKARLRLERFDDKGNRVETVALSNIKFQKIADSTFRWTAPAGVKVTNAGTLYQRLNHAQRNASWLRVPFKLPKGYVFESAVVNSEDAWLRYSNGARRFSIFQQRTKDTNSKTIDRVGSGWYWQKGGNRFVIAGLPIAQAKLVAASVR